MFSTIGTPGALGGSTEVNSFAGSGGTRTGIKIS